MNLSGFTFIRNAIKYDFPFQEAVESMLPLVSEMVINIGKSEDGTEKLVEDLIVSWKKENPAVSFKTIHSVWDDSKTDSGLVLSEQTNIALKACTNPWALYLQADEAIHEDDFGKIKSAIANASADTEAISFRYLHFYGGYTLVQRPWNWYPTEIRIIRTDRGIESFGDAQTFKKSGEKPKSLLIDAHIYHYGHARHPDSMKKKIHYFHRFWHGDKHGIAVDQAYNLDLKNLCWFWGTHPKVYSKRISDGIKWSPKPEDFKLSVKKVLVIKKDSFLPAVLSKALMAYLKKEKIIAISYRRSLPRFLISLFSRICWFNHEEEVGFTVPEKFHETMISKWVD